MAPGVGKRSHQNQSHQNLKTNKTNNCVLCVKEICNNEVAPKCEKCEGSMHLACCGVTDSEYEERSGGSLILLCNNCHQHIQMNIRQNTTSQNKCSEKPTASHENQLRELANNQREYIQKLKEQNEIILGENLNLREQLNALQTLPHIDTKNIVAAFEIKIRNLQDLNSRLLAEIETLRKQNVAPVLLPSMTGNGDSHDVMLAYPDVSIESVATQTTEYDGDQIENWVTNTMPQLVETLQNLSTAVQDLTKRTIQTKVEQNKSTVCKQIFNGPAATYAQILQNNLSLNGCPQTHTYATALAKAKTNINAIRKIVLKNKSNITTYDIMTFITLRNRNSDTPITVRDMSDSVIVKCKDGVVASNIQSELLLTFGTQIEISEIKHTNPRIKIVGIHTTQADIPDLTDQLKKDNEYLRSHDFTVESVYAVNSPVGSYTNVIISSNYETHEHLMMMGYINYEHRKLRIFEEENVIQCSRCWGYGHLARRCTFSHCCRRCAGPHRAAECTNEKMHASINCIKNSNGNNDAHDVNHGPNAAHCPARRRRVEFLKQYLLNMQ